MWICVGNFLIVLDRHKSLKSGEFGRVVLGGVGWIHDVADEGTDAGLWVEGR